MRVTLLFIAATLLFTPMWTTAAGDKRAKAAGADEAPARAITLQTILISASNEKGETDARLAAYERNLKSSLRFESFRFLGEGSAKVDLGNVANVSLPQGQSVKIETAHYGEGMVWLRVIWMDGGRQFMNVVYGKWPLGKPIVIGGLSKDGQNLGVIITAH